MTVGSLSSVGFDKLSAAYSSGQTSSGTSALKGAMNTQKIVQGKLSEMLRDVTPHIGQNIDTEA